VGLREFQLFGEEVVDLSPLGMLVRCDRATRVGDDVVVSFKAPGADSPWLDAEAEVARLVHGFRKGDRGTCAALRFTYFEKASRQELLARLAGFPPPIPQRRLLTARERIASDFEILVSDETFGARVQALRDADSVVVRPIVALWDEPVFSLVRRKRSLLA
jgi:hypothetical protein